MDEAAVGLLAARKDLGIIGPDPVHLLLADLGVVQWRAPLGGALEHGQMAGGLGHLRDGLHAGRAGADHRDALAFEAHRFLRPVMGVAGLALECRDAGDGRHRRRRQHADRGNQQASGVAPAVLQDDVPAARVFLVMGGGHPAPALDVAAQVELVGDVIQIALGLGLRGEVFLPVPFLQQFLREGIAVGPAFGIEAGARVAVPVPGAADAGAGLEHAHLSPSSRSL